MLLQLDLSQAQLKHTGYFPLRLNHMGYFTLKVKHIGLIFLLLSQSAYFIV